MPEPQDKLAPLELDDASDETARSRILAFYRECPELTLKTLVCRAYSQNRKEYIAVVVRGDLNIDFEKLKKELGLSNIRLASKDEMSKLGLVVGYVSPIDCGTLRVIGDHSIKQFSSYYDGGNRMWLYRKNVNYPRDFAVSDMLDVSDMK